MFHKLALVIALVVTLGMVVELGGGSLGRANAQDDPTGSWGIPGFEVLGALSEPSLSPGMTLLGARSEGGPEAVPGVSTARHTVRRM